MPTIVQTVNGKVTGLWGSALRRMPNGKLVPLKMGDEVHKGDVILTTQDGLVQLTPLPDAPGLAAKPAAPTDDEIDRVIAELNDPDSQTAPAAGLTGAEGGGLQPGLRVGRIAEDVTPVSLAQTAGVEPAGTVPTFTTATAPENQAGATPATPNDRPTATPAAVSGNEDATLPVSLGGTDTDGNVAAVTIVNLPANGTLLLADGVTVVTAGQTLTPAQAAGLVFRPAPDFNGGVVVEFTVTDDRGAVSAVESVQITVLPVNDTPLANAGIATAGPEYSSIPVSLSGTDIDGTVSAITVTSPPAGGNLFLADGVTPVVAGTALTPVQAANLVFVPNPGFTGSTPIGFTVTDNEGASSSAAVAQVNVTPVPTTVTLSSSAAAVAEGGSVVYTATVNHPVAGSALVITLSNGSTITIPVGQTSGSSSPVVPRADDVYVQGTQTQTIAVASTTGGNYSSLVTTSTVATSVSDDADSTTVSLTASAASVSEGGSIVYTATLTSPVTGSPLVITLSNGQTITIPVGASSGSSAPFAVRGDDAQVQGPDTLSVNITGTTGGNFEAVTTAGTATTTVTDDADVSTVTLTASAASVVEGGSITYTATTSAPVAGSPLVVTLSNGATITIPVGASSASSAPIAVRPDDAQVQGPETVTASIVGTSGGSYESLSATGAPATTVTDNADGSTLTLSASAASVAEGGSITYTASVTAPVTGSPLVVTLSNGQTITIPVGASSASSAPFAVRADDAYAQGDQTLSVTVTGTTGGAYEALATTGTATTGTATTVVSDDTDATTATLTASAASVTEGGSIVYTATLNNVVTGSPVVLTLSNGQTITIPVGASSASSAPFAVRADDAQVQGTDTLNVGITNSSGGNFEAIAAGSSVATLVTDDADPTTVTVSASAANVTEGGSIVYTVSLSNAVSGSPLTVTLSNGQSVTIPVGASSASTAAFNVRPDDVNVQADDTLTVTVTGSTGGNFEALTPTGSAVTTVSDDADVSTVTLSSSAASVAEGGSVVYTASVSAPVVGAPLVISLTNGQTITIPVGQSTADSAPFAVRADDNFVQGAQSFSVGIAGTSGGSFEALATTSTVSTTVTDDADVSTVTLSATPSVAEGGTIVYTATLSSAAQTAVVVTLANGSIINIAAGASSGTVNVAAPTDDVYLDAGSVSQTIASATGGNFESLQVNPAAASTTVTDTLDATTVSLTGDPTLSEAGSASYTVSLTSVAQADVTVTLTYSGTAANGVDFSGTTTVTIPAGSSSASFSIAAIDDAIAEGPESFTVAIGAATGGNFESLIVSGANGSVTTGIVDNDISTVSLSATPTLTEAGGTIVYTASVTQAPTTALDVTLSNGTVITIAAGALSGTASVPVAASDDVYVDPSSISATIASTSGGGIPLAVDPAPAVTTITDTIDAAEVRLQAQPTVSEGGMILYAAVLSHPAQTAVTVTLSTGDTITINAGSAFGAIVRPAPADDVHLDAGNVAVTITSASGGNFENLTVNPTPAVTAITDTVDTTTLSLTATPAVAEGGTIVYTATLTSPAQTDVTVTLSNSAVITIAAGASVGTVTVPAPADDVYVDAGNTSVTIAAASGGNFENLVVNPAPAVTAVSDTADTSTVTLTATPSVAEGGNIVYTATLSAPAQSDVTVTLSNGATITILANTSSGSVPVAAPTDDVYLDAGSVSVTIAGASGGNFESLVRNPAAAVTTITDTVDNSTVSLTASPAVAEGGNIVYTATLNAPAQSAVTVTLSNNAVITIAAGASTGTVSVPAPTDDVYTDANNVSATISTATGGNFENLTVNPAAAITTVTDTVDTTTVSLTATPAVAEGGSIVYTASLTSVAQGPVTVTLQSGATITIPNGASSASITVPAPGEDVYVDAANVSDRIVSAAGGNFENLAVDGTPAVTAVSDTIATTTVSLTASATVAEGGNITYTASLTAPAQTAVTVTLSDNSTITIPAGASSASISRPAPGDDAIVDAGPVSLHITGASGGNFEALAVNATPAVTAVTDTVDTTTVSLTGTPSVAEGGSIVYTASLTSPADTAVTVRLSNNATITIAAGASSGSVTVPAPTDDFYNDAGNLSVRIDSASGGNFENLSVDATPVVTAVSDTLDTTTVSLTATPAVAEGGSIVYTASLTSPAQGNVTVTLQSGATITILSGASTGSVSVPAPADDVIVDAGSVSNRITGATGGNFENLAVDATPVTTAVSDTLDTTTVSLSGSGSVVEGNAGSYTVSLTSAAQTAVTVTLTYSGTAADGSDFTGVTTVTIPAGASSASFSIATIDDAAAEGSESFTVAINTATGGNFENLVVSGTNGSVTTGIVDNDVSVVSLSATPAITEAGGGIVYTATLTQAPVSNLTVTLSNGATITVTAGSLSGTVTVPVAANEDVYVDPTSVSATITGTSGGGIALSIDPTPATTAVNDTLDTTTVSLSATPTVAEGGSIVYTATLTSAAESPVTVNLSNGQQITIATGATTGTLTLAAPGDDALVDAGPVSVSITSASGGNFESLVRNPAPAVTTVTDTVDTTTVTLTASPTVAEGGNIVYTATLNNAAGTALTVTLSNGAQIVIAAGTSSNSISVPAPGDDVYADAGNVSATITATSGGNFEALQVNPAAAVTAVTDTVNNTTVTLTATPTVAEGGNIVYTATLTSAAQSPVTVTLSNGQQITIPANASSATLTLPAPADDAVVDAGPVSLTIASATGGNFENLVVNPAAATTTVTDTIDTTTVSLSATGTVAEGGNIVYTASLTSPAGSDLTVTLSNNAVITILAGTSSGSVSVPAPGDDVLLDASTVSASIATVNGGSFEQLVVDTTPAATSVTDTVDTTTVSLTATPSVAEGGNITYTASLNNPAGSNVTITLSNSAVITILAGNSTGTVTLPAPADDFVIDAGPVSATIASATGGNFEALAIDPAPATTAVTDTIGTTTLTLSATGTVAEGGSIVYTASLTSPAGTDLVVTLSNSQTITIPAGASSASISVAAPTDDALIDAGTVSASITGTSGGNFENLSVNSAPATTNITDTIDTTTVTLTATGTVAEGGNIVYTASLNNAAGSDVTITLSNNAVITILAGASTGSVTVAAPGDDALVDAGPVSATITTATGGNFESLAISPTAATTTVTDTVDTTTATLTATPSVAEGGSIVYTASLNAAAGSPVTITLSNGAQINIAAGASSGSVSVLAPTDDVYLDASTVSAHITNASGGNFESLVADSTPVSTSITDTINTTTVSLSGSGSVAEGASASYTVSLTSPAQTIPVTVTLSYSGTAADGSDFTGTTTVNIPAGSSSANFSIATIDDALAEGAESFTITLASATGGNFENLAVSGSAGSVTTGIVDNDISTLSLSATPSLTEAGGTIVYTATLTQAPVTALDVTLSNGQIIHINAGSLTGSVNVPVVANEDVYVDPTSVSATITSTSGGGIALSVNPAPAVTNIVDTVDTTTVTIGGPAGLTEGTSGTYTLTLSNPAQTDVTVTIAYGGTASAADRSGVTTVTIPAGATSATFSVAALDDALADSGETVVVTVAGATGGNFENLAVGAASSVTSTISDEAVPDTVLVSLTGPGTVTEGATTGNYTVTLGQAAVTPVTVNLNYSGTAVDGSDYNRVVSVTIPAGATSATFNLATLDDVIADSGDTIVVSLGGISGGGFEAIAANGAASSVTTVINDEATPDAANVTLGATATVAEGGSIVYTATLTHAAQTNVTVTLSNTQQITILAGNTTGSITVPAPTEDVYVDAGSVSVIITGTSGGGFEALTHSGTPAVTSVTDTIDTTTVSLSGAASVAEGASASYTVSLTSPAQGAGVTVTLRYSGVAADGSDFTGVTTVTIPAGSSSANFSVATLDDNLAEGAESFTVTIDNATGGNFENLVVSGANASVSTGIVDNDVSAIATVSAASAVETVSVVHTVTLSNPSTTPTTYSLSLTDGTATGGTDYTASLTNASFSNGVTISGGVITVPAGVTSFTVSVPTLGDTIDEADETYTLNVGGVAATGTVLDDDAAPTIASVSPASATEGAALVHTVTLSNASSSSTSFAYTLGGGTATGGGVDYGNATFSNGVTLSGGNLIVPPGVTSFTVTVPSTQDTVDEPDETYNLSVGGVAAIGTIGDDDAAPTVSSVSAATQVEGTALVHTVTLTNASSVATSYAYTLGGGTATAGSDYTAPPTFSNGVTLSGGNLIVPAGVTSFTITVPTSQDTIDEGSAETYDLSVGGIAALGTITDDDNAPTISSVSNASAVEASSIVHTVTLTNPSSVATTYSLSLTNGTASGADYTSTLTNANFSNGVTISGGTITVPAGVTSFTVSVPTTADTIDEADETYTLTVGAATGTGTITDDDNAPTVATVTADTQTEGTVLVHTVTLSNASSVATSFAYTLGGGTATGGGVDYSTATFSNGVTLSGGNLIVPAGVTSFTVTVPTTQDTIDEPAETYTLTVGGTSALGTINDDDNAPTISAVTSAFATEGSNVLHTVTLSNASSVATTYSLSLADGTASSADYTSALTNAAFSNGVTISGGVITVPAGVTSFTVSVPTTQDALDEANETYTLTVGGASGTGTINDDDATPSLTVNDVTINEGAGTATFTVTLSAASGQTVTVNYATANGSATTADYTAASGVLTFAPGVTTQTITVAITDDSIFEASENFTVNLTAPLNATIADAQGVGTITDNDSGPAIAGVSSPTVAEGSNLVYTVTLTNASSTATSFAYTLGGGTAAAADYGTPTFSNGVTLSGGTLTVPAGVTNFTVTLPTTQDALDEADETVPLNIGGTTGTGTITDDDPAPSLAIGDVTVNEAAGTATFTVSLSAPSGQTVTVGYGTANGSATTADYTATSGTLTFGPGVTSQTITVSINDDNIFEGSESFNVNLSTPVNATIADGQGVGTITDNDAAPTVAAVSATSATEGADIVHTVTLSNPSASATTYTLSLGGGTATGGGVDYTSALTNASFSNGVTISGGTITVPAGVTSFTVTVPTALDTIDEGASETYNLTVGGAVGTGTILDDDNAPAISSVTAATALEGVSLVHTVTLSNASSVATTFAYSLGGGTATGGGVDYSNATFSNGVTLSGGLLTVPAGVTSFTVTVPTTQDTIDEGASEDYTLSVGGIAATGTITDDDNAPTISSVSAASATEGANLVHTVTLSNASSVATSFAYTLGGGTATGGGTDYGIPTFSNGVTLSGGNLIVPAGVTSFTVTVPSTQDTIDEPNETYTLSVGGVGALGTINDDDNAPTISSVSAASATEGSNVLHTVTLSNASSVATTYTLSLADGTASSADYTSALTNAAFSNGVTISGGVITVPAGVTSFTVSVPTTGDTIDEPNETYTLTVGGASGVGTINDDDNAPSISSVSAATQTEGSSLVHTVTLSNASSVATSFAYTLGGGTATGSGTDYGTPTFSNGVTLSGGNLIVPAGVTSFTVTVPTTQDTIDEPNETYNLTVGGVTGIGTINDDDNAPTVSSVSSASATEASNILHTVTLSNASSVATTYSLSFANGTASSADYTSALTNANFSNGVTISGGTITVPAGITSFTVSVPTTADTLNEANETYTLTVGGTSGTGTINDDDAAPSLAINDVTVNEAAGTATFTVTLSAVSGQTVTVGYNTSNGTATAGSDYSAATGTLTFAPGVTTQTITVPITNDSVFEGSETFNVNLSGATNATIADNLGVGTIRDDGTGTGGTDNDTPTLAVSSASFAEGSGYAQFTVSLSNPSATATAVSLSTTAGTATSGTDYGTTLQVSTDGGANWVNATSATIAAGATSVLVRAPITNDTLDEIDETFSLTATRTGGTTTNGAASGTATILDDDAPPTLAINDVSVNEAAGTATFTVTLSAASGQTVTVNYGTANNTATAGSDYTATSGTLTFAPGVTSQTITVSIANDTLTEATESFFVNLSGATNATISDTQGVGSIVDNDAPPAIDLDGNNSTASGNDYSATFTENGSPVAIADTDIAITDVDSTLLASATITLTNAQAGDVLAAGSMPAGITATVSGNVVTLSGSASLAAYQTAIRAVTYANTSENPNTTDRQISVVVNDGTSSSAAATAVIHVTAVNDAPVHGVPGAQSTAEDTPLVFSAANGNAITVADVDSGSVTTTVSVNNGTLTLGSIAGVIVVGNGTGSVQITGTPAAVTAALNGTAYANTADYNGPATLTVSTSDGVAPAVVSTVGITVNAVADVANDAATTNEDNAVTLSVLANDSFENAGRTITAINGSAITAGGPAVAVANGTVSLNAAGQLIYTPTANYNGAASFNYTVTSGGVTETATVNVTVNAVNDAPVNTVPATQTTAEDTSRSITGLAISDVDGGSGSMTVTLAVTNGTLTVSGGTATIANSGTGSVTLTGTIAQINATLASNVTYVPSANFNGAASLTMTTNDNGNTGSGGALSDTDTVTINVTPVNDAPVATGSAIAGTEDTALVFNWAQFGVTDIDSASSSLGIRVSTLPADGTLQVYNGSAWVNVAANTLVTKATIDAGSFRFVPDANESGSDAYGGSGVGNQQADYARFTFTPNDGALDGTAAMMRIDIAPVADAPTVSHNASVQVTGTLSTLTSIGLSRDYYNAIPTLASGASSTNPDVGEVGIETAVPTSSALVTNVGVAGNLSNDTGVQVAADDAYRVQGLIYMQAGSSYVFSGYADDTVRLEIGGNTVMSGQWGGSGQAMAGTFTSNTFTPTVTGYYSIEFMVYNTSGPGSYDLNLSVNGATAVDLSTSNFLLFQSINQVDAAGAQRSAFIPNATTGEGGYYPVVYDAGVQSRVYLAPVLASLTDTDGSESLAVTLQGIPVGAVLTDGTNTFTASGAATSVNITTWNRSTLSITFPSGYAGSTTLTAVATSTEATTGATATTSTSFAVTVDPTGTTTSLAEIGTFNGDALIGQAGNDVYSVSQVGTGLTVSVTQGATGSIPAQSGTDTTGTIHQAFNTGGGNDYVQAGAGDDTIYLGDTGSSVHPVGGGAPTQAHVAAARVMTLADDTTLTSSTTGLFTNEADDTNANNNSAGNTSITTWSDVANGGSGNDVIYGQNGTDFLYGGTGDDYLNGGAGIDGLRGGAGNDTLVGGAGNDVLRGDAGADVFKWEFADRGAVGTPASDIIMDFNTATPANGGDVLDLRDLLQGEATSGGASGNLSNYLHFTVSGGTTTIAISSSGGFSSGYSAGAVDQSIVLQNVDLTSGGALTTDQQIINDLLNKSKLLVDGT